MSNLSDLVKAITDDNANAADYAGSMLGLVADSGGAIGLGLTIYDSLSSQDDGLQQVLAAIQNEFSQVAQQLQSQIAAGDKLARMRDIDVGINPAVAVFEQLPAILASQPPVSQDFKLTQIKTCLDSVLFFTDYEDKWKAVAAGLPSYSDTWSGNLAPQPDADGLVFNYSYTLPQFLRAIGFFLAAVNALESGTLSQYADVLNKCINRLQWIHDTVTGSGIVGTRIPSGPGTDPTVWLKDWYGDTASGDHVQYLYGAVEIYSAASNIDSYSKYLDWFSPEPGGPRYTFTANFFELIQLRVVRKMKELYAQIGMPAVRNAIQRLQGLAGQPVTSQDSYEAWPFSEVISLLHLTLPPQPPPHAPIESPWSEPPGLEQALANFLRETPPWGPPPVTGQPMHHAPLPSGSLYTYLTGVSLRPVAEHPPVLAGT